MAARIAGPVEQVNQNKVVRGRGAPTRASRPAAGTTPASPSAPPDPADHEPSQPPNTSGVAAIARNRMHYPPVISARKREISSRYLSEDERVRIALSLIHISEPTRRTPISY